MGEPLPSRALAARRHARRRRPFHHLFVLPALAIFALFVAYPIGWVAYTSLFAVSLHGVSHWAGLGNYRSVLDNPTFWIVVRNMFYWALITIPVQMVIGGLLAWAVEEHTHRSRALFRTLFFVPVITSVVVIAIVWSNIYAPYYGILQQGLSEIGIHFQTALLGSAGTAIFAIIIVNVWEWTGFSMLMYIAGLKTIPVQLLEAARMDGASGINLARFVLVPALSGVNRSLLLLGVIGTLQTFPLVFLMTDGGPDHASEVFGTYIFRHGFVLGQTGYASALSVVVLVIALVMTLLQIRFLGSKFSLKG